MKASPAAFQVTSVTWRNIPSTGGNGGLGCLSGSVPSSEASCLRPKTMETWPAGLNLTTMSEPLSAAQMLSNLSTLTSHRVRIRPRVQVVANLANERPIGAEFQKLRRCRGIGRPGGIAARVDKNMSLGIDSHAGGLAEIQVLRKL